MRRFLPDRLDCYILVALAGPLALCLGIMLIAQLLERLLRLFDIAAATGAGPAAVLSMAMPLVPHYLGLSLPSAFFAAIFIAVARLGDDNEIDVMLATGRSIARISAPCFFVAALISLFNLYLFGYLQPLSRYRYHVATHEVLEAGWNARVQDKRFVNTGHGLTLSADSSGATGRDLQGVFVERRIENGEEITTAPTGQLVQAPGSKRLSLHLNEGMTVRDEEGGGASVARFASGDVNEDFSANAPPYRPRGDTVRELTFPELRERALKKPGLDLKRERQRRRGEFNGRLARALVPPMLPLMAFPLGMAAKRGRRAPGIVFAALALLLLNQALQFGTGLAQSGHAGSIAAVWIPFGVFGVIAAWLFRGSLLWPGDNPVMRAVNLIEAAFEGMARGRRKASA